MPMHSCRARSAALLLILSTAVIVVAACSSPAVASETRPPNFVLLYMDNVGYADLGCYGNTEIRTPNIDRLAAESVRATQFYVGSPSCTPSRGAILTGRHPERTGLNWQLRPEQQFGVGLPLEERIIPAYLRPLGYANGCFGKWNIGFGEGGRPLDRGFDEYLGHASGNINYYTYRYRDWNDARRGNEEVDLTGQYCTDVFADAAAEFVRRNSERPFFCYVPFNAPHFPGRHNFEEGEAPVWQAPEKYMAMYGLSGTTAPATDKRGFYAVMSAMDDAIGRILRAIDDSGQRENTIVALISDNGAFMLPGRGKETQSNHPFRDGGVTLYEGGIRVVAMFRWPGRFEAGGTCDEPLWTMDLLPTFVKLAGGELPKDLISDGRDVTAVLEGQTRSPHAQMAWKWRNHSAIRVGDWKLVRPSADESWELYDLAGDPGETTSLADQKPDLVAKLEQQFERWSADVGAAE